MDPTLLPLLVTIVARAAREGTLIDIVETFAKLVRLIEPIVTAGRADAAHR